MWLPTYNNSNSKNSKFDGEVSRTEAYVSGVFDLAGHFLKK